MNRLEKFDNDASAKRAQLVRELAVLDKLGNIFDGYEEPMVHFSKLYGRTGVIHFRHNEYSSIRKGKNPDRALFAALLAAFPPSVQTVRVKDGCTSFRPDIDANNIEKADLYDAFGVLVRVQTYQSRTATFAWWHGFDGELWEIEISFPWHQTDLGVLDMRASHYGGNGPVASWDRCELKPKHDAQRIRWSSGSADVPNSFTLYWDRDSGARLDFPSLIKEA